MALFDISDKRILITGASSGIGNHFAVGLSRLGAEVILGARRKARCEQTVQTITEAGGKAMAVELDVNDPTSVQQALTTAGAIDILVNNAGINRVGQTHDISEADWQAVMDTNLNGVWRCSQQAISSWMDSGRAGQIINIASIVGLRVANQLGAYAAAKAGVVHLTRSIALDYARHQIRCNAICPGYFETDINRDVMQTEAGQKQIKRVPMRRMGDLDELMGPLVLLCSDASSYMTGSIIAVDGGHLCSTL